MSQFDVNIPITLDAEDLDAITAQETYIAENIPINGANAVLQGAILPLSGKVYINSVGDDSDITFAIVGSLGGVAVTETLTGANAGTATSAEDYEFITSITSSGATSGNITVGFVIGQNQLATAQTLASALPVNLNGLYASGFAKIPNAAFLKIDCAADESGNTFTVSGIDVNDQEVSTSFAGPNATTAVVEVAFKTVQSFSCSQNCAGDIQLGITTQTYTKWVPIDGQRDFLSVSCFALFSLDATATVTMENGVFTTPYDSTSNLIGTVEDTFINAVTANTGTILNNPVDAVRLKVTAYTDGEMYFSVRQANSGHAGTGAQ